MGSVCLPFEYFDTCSESGLESYELSRLNQASNLRKEFGQSIEQWIECQVEARVARMTLESRRGGARLQTTVPKPQPFAQQMTFSFPLLDTCFESSTKTAGTRRSCGNRQQFRAAPTPDVPAFPTRDRRVCSSGPSCAVPPSRLLARLAQPQPHCESQERRNLVTFVRQQPFGAQFAQVNDNRSARHAVPALGNVGILSAPRTAKRTCPML